MTDQTLYKNIWLKREHFCAECGCFLGYERRAMFFSHILPKGKYPKLRHVEENIDLLCFECHYKWEFSGKRKEMKVYDEEKVLRLKLLDKQL